MAAKSQSRARPNAEALLQFTCQPKRPRAQGSILERANLRRVNLERANLGRASLARVSPERIRSPQTPRGGSKADHLKRGITAMPNVLIVEDDQAMAVALSDGFQYEGYSVTVARDGASGFSLAAEKDFDIVILDVMLPKMSGFDVCRELRSAGNQIPIIMLTARGQEIDKVLGLKIGADDYITKPL